jgi:hypothetical protein
VAARPVPPDAPADFSRAQRYAIGAAIAVSIAGAGCGGTQSTDTTTPGGDKTNAVAGPADGEQGAGEREGEEAEEDYGRRGATPKWRRNSNPCTPDGQCPPYGCVFPDEACDVVRA